MRGTVARRGTSVGLSILLLLTVAQGIVAAQGSRLPANEYFQRVWDRTDRPVAEDVVNRTWMWGPAVSEARVERYDDAEGGERVVQYFDKSRMEINDSDGDAASPWYVTNGLLAVELISGRMQIADHEYEARLPSENNVAGDQGFPNGPTYATFGKFLDRYISPDQSYDRGNALVRERIDRAGIETTDERLTAYGVRLASYDAVTKYNIAKPFWSFMTSSGTVYEGGSYVEEPLFEDPVYATGRPITEPFWSDVVVAGTQRLVLIQCFERRCLTYTPDNPDGWKVEAGNIGQHYFEWRYAEPPKIEGEILFFRNRQIPDENRYETDLYLINADGSGLRNLTPELDVSIEDAVWSPDGEHIALAAQGDLYVMDADGSELGQITDGDETDASPAWSPDGREIAFERELSDIETQIFVASVDGVSVRQVTDVATEPEQLHARHPAWSPDGRRLAFSIEYPQYSTVYRSGIYVIGVDGTGMREIVPPDAFYVAPSWWPDGENILFLRPQVAGRELWGSGLYSVDVEVGSSSVVVVAGDDYANPYSPAWSPDGSRIALPMTPILSYGPPLGARGIHIIDMSTFESVQVTHVGDEPAWSPSGEYLAFTFDRANPGIGVTDVSGQAQWVVTDDGWFPQWRPGSGG